MQLGELHKDKLEPGEEDASSYAASIAGRMMMRRVFGKLAFEITQDSDGTTQTQADADRLGVDRFKQLKLFIN